MFLLDSLMISGLRWTLETVVTAAEAELNDDTALREQLIEAEMRRELGEINEEEFRALESDLLARIREIRERRDGGSGPLALASSPVASAEGHRFNVEASLAGDFHAEAPAVEIAERPPRALPTAPSIAATRTAVRSRRPRARATPSRRRS